MSAIRNDDAHTDYHRESGIINFWPTRGSELYGALILSGYVNHEPQGRYCFQTTYLDDSYPEYYQNHGDHKIIWVLRNPFSVVYSLVHHWANYALRNTYHRCGAAIHPGTDNSRRKLFVTYAVNRLYRACLVYNAKVSQLFDLLPRLGRKQIMVLDYDDLVHHKEALLPKVYEFVTLEYSKEYADRIHGRSLDRRKRLPQADVAMIQLLCEPTYRRAKAFCLTISSQ